MPTEFPPPHPPGTKNHALLAELAAYRLTVAVLRLKLLIAKANFNPNEPRVPAGNPGGGQWTDGGGGWRRLAGGSDEETRPNRSIVDETLDPTGELHTQAYSNALQKIRQLEPTNPQLQTLNVDQLCPKLADAKRN